MQKIGIVEEEEKTGEQANIKNLRGEPVLSEIKMMSELSKVCNNKKSNH